MYSYYVFCHNSQEVIHLEQQVPKKLFKCSRAIPRSTILSVKKTSMSTNASATASECEGESLYYNQLDQEGKARYKQKLDLVEG